jgi:dihydroorotate dehydrogenase electron transfer subunit
VTLCYGVRTAEYFAAVDEFAALGVEVRLTTDDGSRGHHGRVTDVLKEVLTDAKSEDESRASTQPLNPKSQTLNPAPRTPRPAPLVFCCGPEPMMEAVAEVCRVAGVACHVSLETPMACGVGICFTCVAKVRQADGEWDYKRTCVEGPVFDAQRIVWDGREDEECKRQNENMKNAE